MKINELQESALKHTTAEGLATLMEGINNNIKKLEDHVTQMKRGKFKRDTVDYQKGEIYTWRKNRPRPILKPRNKNNKGQNVPQWRVSFSEYNTTMETSYASTSDDHPESPVDRNRNRTPVTNRGASKNDEGEQAANMHGSRYPRRTKYQKNK